MQGWARWTRQRLPLRAGLFTLVVLLTCSLAACAATEPDRVGVSLIIKTQTNPYFVSMRQSAEQQARKNDVHLSVAAGTADGDTQTQINAIDTAIAIRRRGVGRTAAEPVAGP